MKTTTTKNAKMTIRVTGHAGELRGYKYAAAVAKCRKMMARGEATLTDLADLQARAIAERTIGIDSLEMVGHDAEDFIEVTRGLLRKALREAYLLGRSNQIDEMRT